MRGLQAAVQLQYPVLEPWCVSGAADGSGSAGGGDQVDHHSCQIKRYSVLRIKKGLSMLKMHNNDVIITGIGILLLGMTIICEIFV